MGAEMSDALRKAFEIAGRLPKREQDELAAALLEELASDECWDAALGQPQEALARLADDALGEHRAGRNRALDLDVFLRRGPPSASVAPMPICRTRSGGARV